MGKATGVKEAGGRRKREGQGRVVSLSRVNFKAQFPACSGEEPLGK